MLIKKSQCSLRGQLYVSKAALFGTLVVRIDNMWGFLYAYKQIVDGKIKTTDTQPYSVHADNG